MELLIIISGLVAIMEKTADLITKLQKQLPDDIPPERIKELNQRIKNAAARVKAAIAKRR